MKKKMTILAVLLLAVVVTAYSVSGTYAKYTSSLDVSDEARVAHWYLDKGNIERTFNLFDSSYTLIGDTYVKNIEEANKPASIQTALVAPGTSGEYKFSIDGEFETDFTLKAELIETEHGTTMSENNVQLKNDAGVVTYDPIEFSLDNGTTWVKYADLNTALNKVFQDASNNDTVYEAGKYSSTEGTNKIEATIKWRWLYSTGDLNDTFDTKLGNMFKEGTEPNIKLTIRITATQNVPGPARN